ncbi:hypothetical protein AOE58_00890 [Candidatus Riesia pthiripubis]|uniref:Thioredoxin n=1 Tax=Candidatus Riesia pthiripubis TaxID=428412 RepID=A0A1V0HPB6_9ENTR|nr:hypothetical protein AOE58_00890 [Candidatus Riesia pthiripubis]
MKENKLVLIDFWADWCEPCKLVSSVLDRIHKKYKGKVLIGKLNIDQYSKVIDEYKIRSIPTLILFKNDRIIDRKVGLISKNKLDNFLKKNI